MKLINIMFLKISRYTLDEMDKLLEEIIEHYSGLIEPDLLEVKLEPDGREYKKIILGGPGGKTKKKTQKIKEKNTNKKNKTNKKNLNNI